MRVKLKRLVRYIRNNKWEVIFFVILVLFLMELAWGGYNYYQTMVLKEENNAMEEQLSVKKEKLRDLASQKKFQRYEVAKYIEEEGSDFSWRNAFDSLVSIFNRLRDLGEEKESLVLSDFTVDMEEIGIKGKIQDLKRMYTSGGIIDEVSSLDFIRNLNIPVYKKEKGFYKFDLNAKIVPDVKSK